MQFWPAEAASVSPEALHDHFHFLQWHFRLIAGFSPAELSLQATYDSSRCFCTSSKLKMWCPFPSTCIIFKSSRTASYQTMFSLPPFQPHTRILTSIVSELWWGVGWERKLPPSFFSPSWNSCYREFFAKIWSFSWSTLRIIQITPSWGHFSSAKWCGGKVGDPVPPALQFWAESGSWGL